MLVVAGGAAPGGAGAAVRGVLAGAGRWCGGHGDAGGVRRVQPAAGSGPRRPVQVLRRGRRRHRLGRGRGRTPAGAAVGRAPQRASGAGDRAGYGDQSGRRLQRPDRAERPFPAAGDPAGTGRSGPDGRGRRHGGGTWYGDPAGRPDRGAGRHRDLRSGSAGGPAALAGFDQVEHGPHPGRRRRRGNHQGDSGDAVRGHAEDVARGRAVTERGLVGGPGGAADRGPRVGEERSPAPGGRVLLRHQRHQRPRHHRGGARDGGALCGGGGVTRARVRGDARAWTDSDAAGGAAGGVGPQRGGAAGAGGAAGRARGGASGAGPGRCRFVAGEHAGGVRAACGGDGRRP
ncbi:hypothetical protein PS9374_07198 [Planomonospora sphaerica]|uniref:Uncharacterized protein n=1 Tax=Planomonospora sphaerica TaxID=161355 RepID=A0A161LS62_9ACTN|nr:hypothetical protein PS9374_07198 [Planomonospora sphaerica]